MKIIIDGKAVNIPEGGSSSGGGGGVPKGAIVIWSGSVADIPSGWVLCDGQNGTPDLRGRFILGAGVSHSVGDTGGEEEHTLTLDEMPQHSHAIYVQSASNSASTVGAGNGSTSYTTASTNKKGRSQPHNNMPPYYALCYIMKVSESVAIDSEVST